MANTTGNRGWGHIRKLPSGRYQASYDPNTLRRLFTDAVARFWDEDAYRAVLAREERDVAELDRIIANLGSTEQADEEDDE